jgi:hypothetical protein
MEYPNSVWLKPQDDEFEQPIGIVFRKENGKQYVYIGRGYGLNQEDDERLLLEKGVKIERSLLQELLEIIKLDSGEDQPS